MLANAVTNCLLQHETMALALDYRGSLVLHSGDTLYLYFFCFPPRGFL